MQQRQDSAASLLSQINFTINRNEIMETINQRSNTETYKLYLRRFVSKLVNLCVVCSGMSLIIIIQDRTDDIIVKITEYVGETSKILPIVAFVPTIILSILNILIGIINKALVEFEMWDFPDQNTKNEIYGAYL